MKSFVCTLAASMLLLPFTLLAQTGATSSGVIPEVDMAEAMRRGSMVTQSGMGVRAADETAVIKANAPPADDNNRWHITVFSSDNCPYCVKLKKDFETSPDLLAFVAAPEGSVPWAHFNVYNGNDATQQWRIKPYNITAYPTVVVQPPRDWSWGDPGTVICKIVGYDGNAKNLNRRISESVRAYAKVMGLKGYPKPPRPVESLNTKEEEKHATPAEKIDVPTQGAGQYTPAGDSRTAPFAVPSPVDPFRPQTYPVPSPGGDFGPPMAPSALTIDQITAAIPDASPEFILAQYQAKPTDISAVKLAWLVEKTKKPAEPAKVPEPTPLTYEQTKELMPLEDASILLAVVESKPTSKEQALAVAADVKKKQSPQQSQNIADSIVSVVSSVIATILGPQTATVAVILIAIIAVLAYIAPLTKTKMDDEALLILRKAKDVLAGKTPPAKDPSSTS